MEVALLVVGKREGGLLCPIMARVVEAELTAAVPAGERREMVNLTAVVILAVEREVVNRSFGALAVSSRSGGSSKEDQPVRRALFLVCKPRLSSIFTVLRRK